MIDERAARVGISCIKIMDVSAAQPRVASLVCAPFAAPTLPFFLSLSLSLSFFFFLPMTGGKKKVKKNTEEGAERVGCEVEDWGWGGVEGGGLWKGEVGGGCLVGGVCVRERQCVRVHACV